MAKRRSFGSSSSQPRRGAGALSETGAGKPSRPQEGMEAVPPPESEHRVGVNAVHPRSAGASFGRPVWLGALLFLVVAGVFLPALRHGFITYDDPAYVTGNPNVQGGLTWENVEWAWRSFEHSNWHPLTWMSHMLDCQLFGLAPWGHHLTNVLLHASNALLLFVVLRRATGAMGRSLFVAALFGLHPMHVESVAWIAERKDVLSTMFWMLTLWAYLVWAERVAARRSGAWIFYGLAFFSLAAGLTAKPMLVTLPCVLLLLDVWPLGRWSGAAGSRRCFLVAEKLPFFALSVASSVATYLAQQQGGAVKAMEDYSLWGRVANALIAYCQYLGKCFWPTRLAVLYPNLGELPPWWLAALAGALLAVVSVAAAAWRRRLPYLTVGWFWFLGTLVPVIGLVQVGGATMADRYSYVPLIGIFILVAWAATELSRNDAVAVGQRACSRSEGACEHADLPFLSWFCRITRGVLATASLRLSARLPHRRVVLGVAAGVVVLACTGLTCRQLSRWKDGVTLFRHTLDVTENNWMAHYNLSLAYGQSALTAAEAKEEFRQMVAIIAGFAEVHNRRGLELARTPGRLPEAIAAFEKALRIKGDVAEVHNNLGLALAQTPGRLPDAIDHFQAALRYQIDYPEAQYNLGNALVQLPDRLPEAIAALRLAVWGRPDWAEAHRAFAAALALDPNRRSSAIAEYETALRLQPELVEAREALTRLRAGDGR